MTYRSTTQPLCQYCGKSIPKATANSFVSVADKMYRSVADVQRATNQKVVHVRYTDKWVPAADQYGSDTIKREKGTFIDTYSTWDGESYIDEFFCGGPCTRKYAYNMARNRKLREQQTGATR